MIPIAAFLTFTTALFCIGLYGVMTKRNAVRVIMGVELMLNAGIINFVVFAVYGPVTQTIPLTTPTLAGEVIAFLMIAIAAAEAAVGLSLLLVLYRNWQKIDVSEMDLLKG
ncbi:MAG: F(420)H(2) dehydrogenase subunit K [Candidatus Heimdallarchaeota archaeon LC_3]|nr:MAG: F(420)H(2) dehydrogenase subunit K [Candidatus Heimdallarchaeota archaeon LC_3]